MTRPSRRLAVALAASLALHALAILFFFASPVSKPPAPASIEPITVQLVQPQRHFARSRKRHGVKKIAPAPPVPPQPNAAKMQSGATLVRQPLMSFQDYVNSARSRRQASESAGAVAGAAEETGPQRPAPRAKLGSNGIFQITSLGVRTAEITFLGWRSQLSNSRREVFEVDAGVAGDVELAVVRRIIEVIRRDYHEDFNWESQRLGRVVMLSARPQDEAGLEAFLKKEFFSEEQ